MKAWQYSITEYNCAWWIYAVEFQDLPSMAPDVVGFEIWVCLKMLCTPKPNGFADHYPY